MTTTTPKASKAPAVVAAPPPPPAPGEAAPQPAAIAAEFKAAVAAVEAKESITLQATGARVPGGAPAPPSVPAPPAAHWTPEGIGRAASSLVDALLASGSFEELDPEEAKGVAEDVAYYLSVRWPTGSAWEPELRLGARAVEVIVPRYTARLKAKRDLELEREAAGLDSAGNPKPLKPEVAKLPTPV